MRVKQASIKHIYVSLLLSILLVAAAVPSNAGVTHRERDPLRAKFRAYSSKHDVARATAAHAAADDSAEDAAPKMPPMQAARQAVASAASAAMALAKVIAETDFDGKSGGQGLT
jgi:hypothetical protein